MPTPNRNETEESFVGRCIKTVMDDGTTNDQKEAAAICYSIWRESKKTSNTEIEECTDLERINELNPYE